MDFKTLGNIILSHSDQRLKPGYGLLCIVGMSCAAWERQKLEDH